MRLPLTDQQRTAATSGDDRVYIEASPGSGKTTVAAERYGVCRYTRGAGGRGVLALSFARSARGELHDRVLRRWGSAAMRWPHKVWTLDHLHACLVQHLLGSGVLVWPGGNTTLEIIDTWRGHTGARWRNAGEYRRGLYVHTGEVHIGGGGGPGGYAFTGAAAFRAELEKGICTHGEVRHVLASVIAQGSPLQGAVAEFLTGTISSLIVDEVFDGNILDLRIVRGAAMSGVPTTLIGDPWQALYAFRGAAPDLVPPVVTGLAFTPCPMTESFRFETAATQTLAAALRAGRPVTVPPGAVHDSDVVLSSEWSRLWDYPHVLPLSFGQASNRADAAIALVLDCVVSQRFQSLSTFGPDAAVLLGLDTGVLQVDGPGQLAPVLETLAARTLPAAAAAFGQLRTVLMAMGSKNIPNLQAANMADRYQRLLKLATRAALTDVVPGITIHQAKGREWRRVGVALSPAELARLGQGLAQDQESDRRIYVGLTRAREATRVV